MLHNIWKIYYHRKRYLIDYLGFYTKGSGSNAFRTVSTSGRLCRHQNIKYAKSGISLKDKLAILKHVMY